MANTQRNYEIVFAIKKHDSGVTTLAISPDRKFVYSGDLGNEIVKFDFRTGAVIEKITDVHGSLVWNIAIAPNGEYLVSGNTDVVKVLNTETFELIQNLYEDVYEDDEDDYVYDVNSVAVSPNSITIAVGDKHGGVKLWRKGGGGMFECTKTLKDRESLMWVVVAFSPNSEMFASGGDDRKINVYSVANDFSRMHILEG